LGKQLGTDNDYCIKTNAHTSITDLTINILTPVFFEQITFLLFKISQK
ncbi:MAG: hypothetical protein ACI9WT_001732, partial [Flavobacterium sp.]